MTLLRMEAITKVYPGVIANQDITLEVQAGEVHALLGENGAGKSTLMNILYGRIMPDHGHITWNNQPVRISSTRQAIRLGIGMVHQHFMLVTPFTALENIVLHQEASLRHPWLSLIVARFAVQRLCDAYGLEIDLDQPIEGMSLGMQQRVEIIKALYRGARLLILDEPTAVLTPAEVERLFAIVRHLAAADHAVIFISHKLDEVMAVSQRISVLRDGHLIATLKTADTTPANLARLMVGRSVTLNVERPGSPALDRRDPLIVVENLHVPSLQGRDRLAGLSLSVAPGEIVGIVGVDGNGQRALFEALSGLRKPGAGKIVLLGQETTDFTPHQLAALPIGFIPDDRQTMGLLLDMSVQDNLVLQRYERLAWHGWLQQRRAADLAREMIARFDVRTPNLATPVRKLSGGNQQKVILARVLHDNPPVLIVANPTRGLDVGATEYVYQQLFRQRQNGAAVLLISSDLEEALTLSDRIAIIRDGQIVEILPATDAARAQIGWLMTGAADPMVC